MSANQDDAARAAHLPRTAFSPPPSAKATPSPPPKQPDVSPFQHPLSIFDYQPDQALVNRALGLC